MSLKRKIFGHTLIQVVGRFFGNIVGVVVVALLTRYLGVEGYGNYTTIFAYLFFFASLADLGLYMYTINEVNKPGVDQSRLISAIFSLRLITAFVFVVIAGLVVWVLPYPMLVKHGVVILTISTLIGLLEQIQVAYFQTKTKMIRPALADVVGKLIILTGVVVGINLEVSLLGILWAIVVGHFVQFLINYFGIRRIFKINLFIDKEYWWRIIKKTWPIAVSQIFVLVYFKMDVIFISLLRPEGVAQLEVGLYGAPYKVLEVLIAFVPLFMGLVVPVLAKAWDLPDKQEFRDKYCKTFDALSIVTVPMVIGIIALAEPIMDLIAPGFTGSADILRVLMVAVGIIYFSHLSTFTVNTLGQQKKMLPSYALAAVFAVILYVTLVPKYALFAAAGVTIIIELFVLVVSWWRVRQVSGVRVSFVVFVKSLMAAVVMYGVLYTLSDWNIFILVGIGAGVYGLVMLVIKGIKKELLFEMLGKKENI